MTNKWKEKEREKHPFNLYNIQWTTFVSIEGKQYDVLINVQVPNHFHNYINMAVTFQAVQQSSTMEISYNRKSVDFDNTSIKKKYCYFLLTWRAVLWILNWMLWVWFNLWFFLGKYNASAQFWPKQLKELIYGDMFLSI